VGALPTGPATIQGGNMKRTLINGIVCSSGDVVFHSMKEGPNVIEGDLLAEDVMAYCTESAFQKRPDVTFYEGDVHVRGGFYYIFAPDTMVI
jgi:hypothetical protein